MPRAGVQDTTPNNSCFFEAAGVEGRPHRPIPACELRVAVLNWIAENAASRTLDNGMTLQEAALVQGLALPGVRHGTLPYANDDWGGDSQSDEEGSVRGEDEYYMSEL